MVVGPIVTAYWLFSRRRPRCLQCSTPHVVVFLLLCGLTLYCRGFCATLFFRPLFSPFDSPRCLQARSRKFP
jgi:hypothetical protein